MNSVIEIDFNGWRGLKMTGGPVELIVAPEIGGRVISLTLDGIETFFNLPDLHGKRFKLEDPGQKKDLGWLHYGGYKTWLAPQDNWNHKLPFFDLDSGPYADQVFDHSIHLTSPVCRETGMQFLRIISMTDYGVVTLKQTMVNKNPHPVSWGIWDVTQMKGPGKAIFPLHSKSKFIGKIKGYEDEGLSIKNMNTHVQIEKDLAVLNCVQKENFKYGNDSDEGWICSLQDIKKDQWLAYLKIFETCGDSHYPHECVSEVFDSGMFPYFELEVHSPLQTLEPEETYTLKEIWSLAWLSKKEDYKTVRAWIDKQTQTLQS